MNTVLFTQAVPSLEQVVSDWFKTNSGILDPMEDIEVSISTRKRNPVNVLVEGVNIPSMNELDNILSQSTDVLVERLPLSFYQRHVRNTLNDAGITTLFQLVQKTEAEMLRYRDFGVKCLHYVQGSLREIDPRLFLGMRLPLEKS